MTELTPGRRPDVHFPPIPNGLDYLRSVVDRLAGERTARDLKYAVLHWTSRKPGGEPEAAYRLWHRERAKNDFGLGAVRVVQVDRLLWVANMIGQHGMRTGSRGVPVRYEAIDTALGAVAARATELNASVHMPRIGCGLAGGKWERVEPLIVERLITAKVPVTVYDHD